MASRVFIWQAAGTVLNTDEFIIESLEKTMADFGIDEIEFDFNSELESLKRSGLVNLLHRVAAEFSLDYLKFRTHFLQEWTKVIDQIKLMNGSMAVLKKINNAQMVNWLVSACSTNIMDELLNRNCLQNLIDHLISSSQLLTRTSLRDVIQTQLKASQLPSSSVTMICSDAIGMQVALDLNITGILLDYDGIVDWQLSGQIIHSLDELQIG